MEQFAKDNSYWLIQISCTDFLYLEGKCQACAGHEKELEQTALLLEGVVKVGKIDAKLIPTLKI